MVVIKTLIKGGTVLDPGSNFHQIADILIENGRILAIAPDIAGEFTIIDARGQLVVPGLIDVHVHLRDPGHTYKEDLTTGTKAAAHGGFTSIVCMPNTAPVLDNSQIIQQLLNRCSTEACVNVFPLGAATQSSEGRMLTDFHSLAAAGVVGFSDDGKVVQNTELMYRALLATKDLGLPLSQHAEDQYLSGGTVINEGEIARRLGVKGDLIISEAITVGRDITLASYTGGHVHVEHVSTAAAVELIRVARKQGIHVTAEVAPHHLILTEEDVVKLRAYGKMRPPLRTKRDVEALRQALADGTIDCIATDHAPHSIEEKEIDIAYAANGIIGLETAVGLILTHLVRPGIIRLEDAIAAWTYKPAEIFALKHKGRLLAGYDADITLINLADKWTVDSGKFYSKARNTAFNGWELIGKPVLTMVAGKVVWSENNEVGGITNASIT